jgi:uncharacterized protein (TIGR02466 family)
MEIRKFTYRRAAEPRERPHQIFATPLLTRKLAMATPELLAHVRAYVLDLKERDKGMRLSNVGGWHSSGPLFDTEDATMKQLSEALLSASAEMTYFETRETQPDCEVAVGFQGGSWANVSRDGEYNKPHIHPGAMWSGVFYVDVGERDPQPPGNGCLEFMDPRSGNIVAVKRVVDPVPGLLVIFPGWLYHYVNPFRGRGERISIAFNANTKVTPLSGA